MDASLYKLKVTGDVYRFLKWYQREKGFDSASEACSRIVLTFFHKCNSGKKKPKLNLQSTDTQVLGMNRTLLLTRPVIHALERFGQLFHLTDHSEICVRIIRALYNQATSRYRKAQGR